MLKEWFLNVFGKYEQLISFILIIAGIVIGSICLFAIPPIGEMAMSALYFISEIFIFAGAIIGINLNFDLKLKKFAGSMKKKYEEAVELEKSEKENE